MISSCSFDITRSEVYGAIFTVPVSKIKLELVGYVSVDDTDQVESLKVL